MEKKQKRKPMNPSSGAKIAKAALRQVEARAKLSPDERTAGLHGHKVNDDNHRACEEFIRYCRAVALSETTSKAQPAGSYYLGELLQKIAIAVADLVESGHVWLLRDLAGVIERLEAAGGPRSRALSRQRTSIGRHLNASAILVKVGPHDVVRALYSLHGDDSVTPPCSEENKIWEAWKGVITARDTAKAEVLLEKAPHLCGQGCLSEFEYKLIQILPENKQSNWLLAHHAHVIETVYDTDFERRNIDTFAGLLSSGWLWNNGFHRCLWFGRGSRPERAEVRKCLTEATGGDPRKLVVFRYWLARRKGVFAVNPSAGDEVTSLADDLDIYVWNQIDGQLEKAFNRLEKLKAKESKVKPRFQKLA